MSTKDTVQDPAKAPDPATTPAKPEDLQLPKPGETKPDPDQDPGQKKHEPKPGSERWNEVYGKMKQAERRLAEQEKDIEAMRAHNQSMASVLEQIKQTKADRPEPPEPDPMEDPEGYKKWVQLKMAKKEEAFQEQLAQHRLLSQIQIESGLRSDYEQAVKLAQREIDRDERVRKQIYGSDNPPRAAYLYGKEIMEKARAEEDEETKRSGDLEQVTLETGGGDVPPKNDDIVLTPEQERTVKLLFPDRPFNEAKKGYIEQLKHIRSKRGGLNA